MSFIAMLETWLDNSVSDSEFLVEGYQFLRRDRRSRGDGILTYIKSEFACLLRRDLESSSDIFNEILVNRIHGYNGKKIFWSLCIDYRMQINHSMIISKLG